jgi:tetratricopeptide (TPR) repeat protein
MLHQSAQLSESEKFFIESEKMQKKHHLEIRFLFSLQGFQFCDLLLSQGKVQEVMERVSYTLPIEEKMVGKGLGLLDIALDKLSFGRAYSLQAQAEGKNNCKQAQDYLNAAVAGLREAGAQEFLARGLFARAFLYRVQNEFTKAWDDLAEAREIAERGSMELWLVDYHLEAGRLCLAEGRTEDAAGHLYEAKRLVEETGYHRRDPEVLLLEAQLAFANGDKENAREWLEKAKATFEKMGIREWDFEVAELERRLRG